MPDWISIDVLAKREGLSVPTLRRYARDRVISFRRKGRGRRSELEFNYTTVHQELEATRSTVSRTATKPVDPTLLTVLNELRALRAAVESNFPCKS